MIKELKLENTFIHKDKSLTFTQGINALVGPNRIGKSSICEAITFGYFGKVNKSTLDKVVNDEADKATVTLEDSSFKFSRIRKRGSSQLKNIKAKELQDSLGVTFKEYMDTFYLAANENYSLFDSAYLRNFLISIFDLDKYKKISDRLKVEYNTINSCQTEASNFKEVDRKDYITQFNSIKETYKKIKSKLELVDTKIRELNNSKLELVGKHRELKTKLNFIYGKEKLLENDKCPECKRSFSEEFKEKSGTKLEGDKVLINKHIKIYETKITAIDNKVDELETTQTKLVTASTKYYSNLQKIKFILEQKKPKVNNSRLKELEQIMPIFSYTGFPMYMLQKYTPSIQVVANSLLQTVFTDMSIKINTQTERNTLALKIEITKDEFIMDLKDCSGSETVLINMCLRLAVIAIYKQFKDTNIDTVILDEALSKFDDEVALSMVDLLNKFIDMGYINQVILITHKTILKDLDNINYIEL